ncbi:hypothetical protein ACTMTF_15260 [Nonomuraea sp. ZG12]|uniref:hypothetical protein n=1 Tax=Nonomuraea sp. ZG12 TaxID=3452207 RepID=UPI003F88F152
MLGIKTPKGCIFDHSNIRYEQIDSGLYEVKQAVRSADSLKPIRWEHIGSVCKGEDGWEISPAGDIEWLPGFKSRALASDYLISWNV